MAERMTDQERRLAARLRSYSDRAIVPIDPAMIARSVASEHGGRRALRWFTPARPLSPYVVFLLASLLALLLATAWLGSRVLPVPPQPTGLIVLARDNVLWTIDPASGHETQIADREGVESYPVTWSGDGRRILFGDSIGEAVYSVRPDGSDLIEVPTYGGFVSWSPDASMVAIAVDSRRSIDIRDLNGGLIRTLPYPGGLEPIGPDLGLAWSPDGKRIAFTGCRGDACETYGGASQAAELWVAAIDGGSMGLAARLERALMLQPEWSPDGRRLLVWTLTCPAQAGAQGSCLPAIGLTDMRGGPLTDVTPAGLQPSGATWSPGGEFLALPASRGGRRHIYTMRADGSDLRQVTTGPREDVSPLWSGDGEYITFARAAGPSESATDGTNMDVWIVSAGGGNERRIATGTNNFAWQP